ncbi:MAG: DUF2868 domain-containing protein [Pseudomonadota bacterium]
MKGRAAAIPLATRLLAEAVRYDELACGPPDAADEAPVLAKARALKGGMEEKVRARALLVPQAGRLARELGHLAGLLRAALLVGLVVAGLAGAATARTAFASAQGPTVNIFWLLAALLGLHLISFIAWLALMALAPRRARGGLAGQALLWAWQRLAGRLRRGAARAAAIQAAGSRWGRGAAGRWLASAVSHGLWSAYLAGALAMTLLLLAARSYHFVWETTILSAAAYQELTQVLAAPLAFLGFAMPDAQAVAAAQWPAPPDISAADEQAFATFLIAALILYGLVPRLLALAFSCLKAWRAERRTPLDLSRPGYARLVPLLSPIVASTKIVDPDGQKPSCLVIAADVEAMPSPPPPGPVYVMGWELPAAGANWPPPGTAAPFMDLGNLDSVADLERVAGAVKERMPARLVVALDLAHTPDRGVMAALKQLHAAAGGRLFALFTGAARATARLGPADAAQRLGDWVAAAHQAGIASEAMIAIDLDHMPVEQRARLDRLLGAER